MNRQALLFLLIALAACTPLSLAQAQKTDPARQHKEPSREPTAAELPKNETVASALLRSLYYQEYDTRSAAEAMP